MDPYEQQLLKVFNSHDIENKGSLDFDGLRQLCHTLQLDDQCSELIKCLLNERQQLRASFIEFKEALLNLLDKLQRNNKTSSDSPSASLIMENKSSIEKSSPDREVSPKFVLGSKKYGRRSRPKTDKSIFNEDDGCHDDNEDDNDIILQSKFAGVTTPPSTIMTTTTSVQRSNSQSEVLTKKRKTNYKLKRCTSLPGQKELVKKLYSTGNNNANNHLIKSNLSITNNDSEILCTEEMLKEAWGKLGVGEDGYLNRSELILVCNAIGLHKLADEVIKQSDEDELGKISINYSNQKISFKDVLDVIQKDETWFNVLNNESIQMDESVNTIRSSAEELFPDSQTFHYITLGPDGNGLISTDILIEMWENVGIHSPKELIHELGFNSRNISVIDLANILEKETRTLNETTRDGGGGTFESTHVTLLQANLTLYQTEIKCLRNILEQFQVEKEKLKLSIYEANNRATLLAQEVDDNHTRMEQNSVNQVKLLEQRHTDMLKELTLQYAKDKEQLTLINQSLEDKISMLETEIMKLKNDLTVAQKYSLDVEKENQLLNGKIVELEKDKETITGKIELLEKEKDRTREIDRQESELLLAKLHALQIKNVELKDRNDEMETEIESLSNQIISMKVKASNTPPTTNHCPTTLNESMEDDDDDLTVNIVEGAGGGNHNCNNILRAKRRSDCSPSKDIQLLKMNGSPRLGKLRKCYTTTKLSSAITALSPPSALQQQPASSAISTHDKDVPLFISSESGFDDTEPEDQSSSSSLLSTSNYDQEEINRLQVKVAFLEQILMQHNIPIPLPTTTNEENRKIYSTNRIELSKRTNELEKIIENVKREMMKAKSQIAPNSDCSSCERYSYIYDRLTCANSKWWYQNFSENKEQHCQTDFDITHVEDKVTKLENEVKELTGKCTDLEDCVDLLRNEYEKCEDYWQNKVDEERQFFEHEQKISGEKLNELLEKMREYEEQYANQDLVDSRLPPIVETANLEKQFTDLEQEFEDYKQFHESEIFKKDEEISELKEKLSDIQLKNERRQADHQQNKMKNFTSYIIDSTCRYAEDMLPPPQNVNPNKTEAIPSTSSCSSSLAQLNWTNLPSSIDDGKESFTNLVNSCAPSTSSSQSSTPCRPKRTRKHERNMFKKNSLGKDSAKNEDVPRQHSQQQQHALNTTGEQSVMIPLRIINNLINRKNYLEQQTKHLQNCMKQQRCHNEQVLQYHWKQFYGECSEMHEKLKYCQEKLDQQMKISNEQLEKLHRNDLFIKDLFVENAYLYANVERLEKQCRLLTLAQQQQVNNSSSV